MKVEAIQKQGRTPQNVVDVRLLDAAESLGTWLAERADVQQLHVNGRTARFLHSGDPQAEAALLKAMIEAGFRVVAFGTQRRTLEDVFMQVTRGLVQ